MAARSSCSPTASMPGPATNDEDRTLIAAMKGGSTHDRARHLDRATPTRSDTYSLSGFTAAYDAMRAACTE